MTRVASGTVRSRRLTPVERRRALPFCWWAANATTSHAGHGGKGFGMTRRAAERRAIAQAVRIDRALATARARTWRAEA